MEPTANPAGVVAGATAAAFAEPRRRWLILAPPLAFGLVSLGITYAPEIQAAVRVWVASTAFNHCFLVVPIAAYLLYARRGAVAAAKPRPAPLIAAAAAPIGAAWFLVERAGIMEGRQLLAMVLVQILVMATLGPRTWRVLAAPLLYLFFLVPVGDYAVPWLQLFTVHFVSLGLQLLGIPHFVDGIGIQIPEGQFLIAEACAGLRFVVASAAFGVFYACLIYVSALRRILFIAASVIVPVLANGCRALFIVVLGHELGSAQAAAVDHVLYGWTLFAIVISLLIVAGLPFRQPAPLAGPARAPERPAKANAAAIAVIAVIMSAALPRLAADHLDRTAAAGFAATPIALPVPSGCTLTGPATDVPPASVSHVEALGGTYNCGGARLVFRLFVFPARTGAGPVFAALRGPSIAPGWDVVSDSEPAVGDHGMIQPWHVTTLERQGRFTAVASALWIDGRASEIGIESRFRQAFAALRGGGAPPAVATVTATTNGAPGEAEAALHRFLSGASGISEAVARSLGPLR